MTTRPLNNRSCSLLDWNEGHVEGLGLVLQVFESACGAGGVLAIVECLKRGTEDWR